MRIKLDKLDVLFSQVVRLRAEGKCEYCGKVSKTLQCSHFHGRRKRSVRWDLDNCAGLCFACHLFLGENPYIHTEWFKKRLGSVKFEQLNIRAQTLGSPNRDKIESMLKEKLAYYHSLKEG